MSSSLVLEFLGGESNFFSDSTILYFLPEVRVTLFFPGSVSCENSRGVYIA